MMMTITADNDDDDHDNDNGDHDNDIANNWDTDNNQDNVNDGFAYQYKSSRYLPGKELEILPSDFLTNMILVDKYNHYKYNRLTTGIIANMLYVDKCKHFKYDRSTNAFKLMSTLKCTMGRPEQ